MEKVKLVTCESGYMLYLEEDSFYAWKLYSEELIEGDVIFEIDKKYITECETGEFLIVAGAVLKELEEIGVVNNG